MAGNGKRRARTPRLAAARVAQNTARSELSEAQRSNDGAKIAAAERALNAAAAKVQQAHTERFEQIATMRGTSATRAIEELIKLAMQRRYSITEEHAAAIMAPIAAAVADLDATLKGAVARSRLPVRTRTINFAGNGAATAAH